MKELDDFLEALAIERYGINESIDNWGNDNAEPYREGFKEGIKLALSQFAVIGSKPITGIELEAVKLTLKKQHIKTPTSLE